MTFTGLLLAGGNSRRMGTDKATLLVAGQPLWARQIRILQALRPEVLWVSARRDPEWRPGGVELVLDRAPSRGPLSGIAAALERLQTTHLLALAIDLPRMSAAHLHKLWSLAQPGQGVIPCSGTRFEPLCAVYPREAAQLVTTLLAGDDVSLQNVAQRLIRANHAHSYLIAKNESRLYLNANTPADLATL